MTRESWHVMTGHRSWRLMILPLTILNIEMIIRILWSNKSSYDFSNNTIVHWEAHKSWPKYIWQQNQSSIRCQWYYHTIRINILGNNYTLDKIYLSPKCGRARVNIYWSEAQLAPAWRRHWSYCTSTKHLNTIFSSFQLSNC